MSDFYHMVPRLVTDAGVPRWSWGRREPEEQTELIAHLLERLASAIPLIEESVQALTQSL